MEPEWRDSHTYIEREKRSGGNTALAFILGGVVVAVALIALVFWGGDFGGGDRDVVGVSTQDQVPAAAPAAPVENKVEINTDNGATDTAPAAAPADTAPAAPAAPAQN